MAKRGTANYRKALSFATKKFDLDSMIVKESGNTIDDVIEYVRVEMYQQHLKQENKKNKTVVIDGDIEDELDDSKDLEDEYLTSLKKKEEQESDNTVNVTASSNTTPTTDPVKSLVKTSCEQKSSNIKNAKESKAESTIVTKVIPPPQWFFPGWFSFIAYGPFVKKDQRLSLLEISDASKKTVKSRAEKRKADKIQKDIKRAADSNPERGFSTDQKLQLEIIDLTRQQTKDRSRESVLMGLCVQEAALTKQIDRAERMAERLAPDDVDDPNNKWWIKVNNLIHKQELIIIQMANLNKAALKSNKGGSNENHISDDNDYSLTNKSVTTMLNDGNQPEILSDLSKESDRDHSTSTTHSVPQNPNNDTISI